MRRMRGARRDDSGGVLITVLLLVSVLSILGVAIMEDIRFGIKQTANRRDHAQAQAFGLGAEQLAVALMATATKANPRRNTLDEPWARGPQVFPLEGGLMQVELSDASNCFNLNSVVEGREGEELQAMPAAVERYRHLLRALEFNDSEQVALSNALVDWIDTDNRAQPQGAEDFHYTGLDLPYRTGSGYLAEVSELRAIRGYIWEVYRRIEPFVCVHPDSAPSELNINTLLPNDAPLLSMLSGERLSVIKAQEIIAQRPPDGYQDLQAFWDLEAWAEALPQEAERALVSLKTRYFDLKVLVVFNEAEASLGSLLWRRNAGEFVVVARRYGDAQ